MTPEQIQPDLRELLETMNRMSALPSDFEGRQHVLHWYGVRGQGSEGRGHGGVTGGLTGSLWGPYGVIIGS